MKLYRTSTHIVLERDGQFIALNDNWDDLVNRADLYDCLAALDADRVVHDRDNARSAPDTGAVDAALLADAALAPVGSQEIWAAGVTYQRSRTARMEEARDAGGGSFYDRVYEAERPELFFKAAGWRACGPGASIRVRGDARWSVPEPELALYINARGDIIGCTIGNDVSSRDIEGENPLYLPQAKIYNGACALGPCLFVSREPLPPDTTISLHIERAGRTVFQGDTTLARLRRTGPELVEFLYRELTFPAGCVLLTGTGIVPPDDFTLRPGDHVHIAIPPIGVLFNPVG